jgi:hypothetical protein
VVLLGALGDGRSGGPAGPVILPDRSLPVIRYFT